MASRFETLFENCVVKPGQDNANTSVDKYLTGSPDWKSRPILVHSESQQFLFAEKKIRNDSYDLESYIVSPELTKVFSAHGFKISKRTLHIWKDDEGQHGIAMINSDSDYSYCASGRQAMALATTGWHIFSTDDALSQYNAESVEIENEPEWHGSYMEMLEESVIDMMIDSEDHDVVQNLAKKVRNRPRRGASMPARKPGRQLPTIPPHPVNCGILDDDDDNENVEE